MSLETPTWISDFVPTNPPGSDLRSQGDNHIRNMKAALQNTLPNADKAFYFPDSVAKTGSYTILTTDMNKFITGDATAAAFNLTLPTLATTDDGWGLWVMKTDATVNAVTLVGTINGATNMTISERYQAVRVWWTGTAWMAINVLPLPLLLTMLNITGGTALTAPAIDDEMAVYDLSATANRKITLANFFKVIGLLTAETAPDILDGLAMFDTSAGTTDFITLPNLLKVLNGLTEDATPDVDADFLLTYDTSASGVKKAKPNNIWTGWRHIVTITAANQSEVLFNAANAAAAFDGTYDTLMVMLNGVGAGTADTELQLQMSGAIGNYVWSATYAAYSSTFSKGSASDSKIVLADDGVNGGLRTTAHYHGTMYFNVDNVSQMWGDVNFFSQGSAPLRAAVGGTAGNSAGPISSIRYFMSAGNVGMGKFSLFGLKGGN